MNKRVAIILSIAILVVVGMITLPTSNTSDLSSKLLAPSIAHPFGTDFLGRDVLKQTLSGLTISILTGTITTLVSTTIAFLFALISSTRCRILSKIVDILVDLTLGIPHIVLMILISFALQKGGLGLIVAISLTHWPSLSRLLTNEIKSVRASDYYQIEMHLPTSSRLTSIKHIFVAIAPQLQTGAALCFPHAILHESSLTFLGFGFSPEIPAIGVILNNSLTYLMSGQWWVGTFPGLSLLALVLLIRFLTSELNRKNPPTNQLKIDISDFTIQSGEVVAIVGHSGCGKTTAAKQIAGLHDSSKVSFIPQSIEALDPTYKYQLDGKTYYKSQLSGGMARRVLVEDSIKPNSSITIADEPTAGLDSQNSDAIIYSLISLANSSHATCHKSSSKISECSLVLITHDLKLAKQISNKIYVIDGCKLKSDEHTLAEIFKNAPENIKVPALINNGDKKIIEANNISMKFGNKEILSQFSYTFNSSERLCIFGNTGCGKTTLAKIISNYIEPSSGKITHQHNVQYVSQNPYQAFNPYIKIAGKLPSQYSGGELQRLSIERALKTKPDFIILDEATSMLDLTSQKEIFEDLMNYCIMDNCGLIFVTHDPALRDRVAQRTVYL